MRVLIVGAGSVGQVYGLYLQRGGAEVQVYIRPRYVEEARAGYVVYPPGQREPERFRPDGIVTTAAEVATVAADGGWDQVWLCVSSTAIRGDWLQEIVAAAGEHLLVSLQPGLRDRELLEPLVPARDLCIGLITFSSWHAPLPGEALPEPGMAWWFPPLTPSLFEGPRAAEAVAGLRAGGCPAREGPATLNAARGSAMLVTLVAAMECAGWTFAGLREPRWSGLAAGAGQQALATATRTLGVGKGPMGLVLQPWALRLATRIVPLVAPMDFEQFLTVHFTKVGDQTMLALEEWIAAGRRLELPVDQLVALRDALRESRGEQPASA